MGCSSGEVDCSFDTAEKSSVVENRYAASGDMSGETLVDTAAGHSESADADEVFANAGKASHSVNLSSA